MRILTIVTDLRPGGTQRVACNFARGYKRWGVESALFARRGGGALEEGLRDHAQIMIGSPDEATQRVAFQQALQWKPDVIHIHREGPADVQIGALLRMAKGASRVGTSAPVGVVETNVFGRVDYSIDRDLVDVHFLLSKWCMWKWRRWSRWVSGSPLGIVLPNLVMHADFSRVPAVERAKFRHEQGIPEDALLFGRVGSPISSKWSPEAVEAFAIYARDTSNAWLLLIGPSADLRTHVQGLPEAIRRRVVLIDFLHSDAALRAAYSAMDVFLHAARIGESFGMVLAESLLCGTPIITLSTPAKDNSQLEVVGHEHGGLVAASVAGMVESMRRMENARLRECYARQGAERIAAQYGPETLIPQALQVASLCAQGLSPEELRRRVLALPDICAEVTTPEIRRLMSNCIGQYPLVTPALFRVVSNPFVYRAYCALARA